MSLRIDKIICTEFIENENGETTEEVKEFIVKDANVCAILEGDGILTQTAQSAALNLLSVKNSLK